jgi:hypothetical protein
VVAMDGQTEKFLLVIVILAVVLAPLREAFALTTVLSAGDRSHCTGMQHLMHSKMAAEGIWHSPGGCAGHCCSHGCDRTCCAGACVHAPVALTGATARVSDARFNKRVPFPSICQGVLSCIMPDAPKRSEAAAP